MIIVGDIGNTETKICFVNSKKKILKKINIKTKNINLSTLKKSIKISIRNYPNLTFKELYINLLLNFLAIF